MDFLIKKYFGFLSERFSFKGPFLYNYSRESYTDFVNGQIVVSIGFDGDYWVNIYKTKKLFPELQTGEMRIIDIDFKNKIGLAFYKLDKNKKIWNSVSNDNFPDKKLWYYNKLISLNPEVLDGNFEKTKLIYSLRNLFKKKK
ncbi:MAG: hypothetical protein ACOYLE_00670 [Bacteroidales bacterium]